MTSPLIAASAANRCGRSIAGAVLLFMFLLVQLAGAPSRAQEVDRFTATVRVDAGADTAAKARDAARVEGQRRALTAIVERLTSGAPVRPPRLDDKTITDLVASFEVANERMSAVRYVADYTFHFRPAETARVLGLAAAASAPEPAPNPSSEQRSATANGAEPDAKPIVVIPVFQSAGQAVLWDDPNPWRAAWEHGLAIARPAVVPLGDAGDVASIDAEKARAGDTGAIAAIAGRNGGETALVAVAVLRGSSDRASGLDVRLKRYRDGRLVDARNLDYSAAPGESADELLRRAVAAIAPDIAAGREPERTSVAAREHDQTLTAVFPIGTLDDWLQARQRLLAVPIIRKVAVTALSRQEATVAIDYNGTIEQLRLELAKISLNLVRLESRWQLARSGADGAP
jgi:hypothetical protein